MITFKDEPDYGFNSNTRRWSANDVHGPYRIIANRTVSSLSIRVELLRDDGGVERELFVGLSEIDGETVPAGFAEAPIDGVIEDRIREMIIEDIAEKTGFEIDLGFNPAI